ncbi:MULTISPECIES: hypothetical protein [Plesiomonas]|uniref:hypothetical protein n=1 Tax=Plesiomonas TaxID=702 RepID=UPI0012625F35|nr:MULTISPECIES: hypothetical protein [Plesiomonas]KAB7690526.1 hypothetical protein GBN28_05995 [Plesiomonas shigelloides]KAB7703194.1 hypothetical protein GBN26_02170 [Plesiomonas shigelloides]KAB7705684.1 hypothetical protein GBN32_16115 [Plesiomonas shigelloides]MCE5163752.1 hypothetical protein [Plesiomonas sp. PI-19]
MKIEAQRISCVNSAAFVMHFSITTTIGGKNLPIASTENFPVGQERTIDLSTIENLAEGTEVTLTVKAVLGKEKDYQEKITYRKNGHTQVFRIHGTTLNYEIQAM